jgi:hypothetical protein
MTIELVASGKKEDVDSVRLDEMFEHGDLASKMMQDAMSDCTIIMVQ